MEKEGEGGCPGFKTKRWQAYFLCNGTAIVIDFQFVCLSHYCIAASRLGLDLNHLMFVISHELSYCRAS